MHPSHENGDTERDLLLANDGWHSYLNDFPSKAEYIKRATQYLDYHFSLPKCNRQTYGKKT